MQATSVLTKVSVYDMKYESDLSNEVLYLLLGQEDAKISEVKNEGRKKSARSAGPRVHQSRIWQS